LGHYRSTVATTFSLHQSRIENVYFESPGTAHQWLTWRRSLNDFVPRPFQ